ncbi:MAG: ribbon-helix-helix domain-containing protein [Eubacteriales bacterium]|nr:ribbon-helix-helix domain-containing protein [Eubacteriales bacterium]
MGAEKPVYSFRLNPELVDALKVLAKEQNRNLSNLVETILIEYVKKQGN